jgi:hypothetical protein
VARGRLSRLALPPNASLDQLAGVAIRAVHGVAAAKQITLPPPSSPSSTKTRDRLIIGVCLLAFIALALLASRLIRRKRG